MDYIEESSHGSTFTQERFCTAYFDRGASLSGYTKLYEVVHRWHRILTHFVESMNFQKHMSSIATQRTTSRVPQIRRVVQAETRYLRDMQLLVAAGIFGGDSPHFAVETTKLAVHFFSLTYFPLAVIFFARKCLFWHISTNPNPW